MLVQEQQARAEAMHAAQHQCMVDVILGLFSKRPAPLQQLQCSFPAECDGMYGVQEYHNSMYRFQHGIYWSCHGIVMVLPGDADAESSTIVKQQQDVNKSAAL